MRIVQCRHLFNAFVTYCNKVRLLWNKVEMVSDSAVFLGREKFKDEIIMAEAIGCGKIDIFQKAIRNLTAASDSERLKEVYDDFNEKIKQVRK